MGGLGFVLAIVLYLVVAVLVARALKGRRAKIIAVVIALLLPTTDAIVGRIYLKYLCQTEGGLRVHRVVENVEGFRWDGAIAMKDSDTGRKQFLGRYGVAFVESSPGPDGKVDRIRLQNDEVIREWHVSPRSTYAIRFVSTPYKGLYIRDEQIVQSIADGEILGSDIQFIFKGGWAEYFLGYFADAGPGGVAWCEAPYPEVRRDELIKRSLRSTSKKAD